MRFLFLLATLGLSLPATAQFDLVPLSRSPVVEGAYFGGAVALSADGTTALVGASFEDTGSAPSYDEGAAYVFVQTADGWAQQARLTAAEPERLERFGGAVALSADGTTALVGASGAENADGSRGAAYVFRRVGNTWSQQARLTASDTGNLAYLGEAVALSADGTTVLIGAGGARNSDGSLGAAFVFIRSNDTWEQQARLVGEPDAFGLGGAVALSADGATALVGVTGLTSGAPPSASYVFRREGEEWVREARFQAQSATEAFGLAVALSPSGDLAVVGDPIARNLVGQSPLTGRVHVYARLDGAWSSVGAPLAPTGAPLFFGQSVSLSAESPEGVGARLLVGAPGGTPAGAVFLYARDASGWTIVAGASDPDDGLYESFGHSAGLTADGMMFIVGDFAESEPLESAGSAYIGASRTVASEPSAPGAAAALSPPWPNPTTGATRLTLHVPSLQRVEVAVYDLLGRRLAVLSDTPLSAAMHNLSLTRPLPPGVYVVRARGETFSATQRLTVIR